MHLGDLLGRLRSEDTGVEALLALGDVMLAAAVETAREGHGETAGDYVAGAVARFSRLASDEDGLGIVTAAGSPFDPAAACLSRMLRWSVARDLIDLARTRRGLVGSGNREGRSRQGPEPGQWP